MSLGRNAVLNKTHEVLSYKAQCKQWGALIRAGYFLLDVPKACSGSQEGSVQDITSGK